MFILYMLIILHLPTILNHNICIHIMLDTLHKPSMFSPHTHIPTLLNHNIYIHIMLDTIHTPSMFTPLTPIMLLFMVEFLHALIMAEKVT